MGRRGGWRGTCLALCPQIAFCLGPRFPICAERGRGCWALCFIPTPPLGSAQSTAHWGLLPGNTQDNATASLCTLRPQALSIISEEGAWGPLSIQLLSIGVPLRQPGPMAPSLSVSASYQAVALPPGLPPMLSGLSSSPLQPNSLQPPGLCTALTLSQGFFIVRSLLRYSFHRQALPDHPSK